LAALDLGADVEQPFDCLIVQNRQAMQLMGRSMDWTLEDIMVDGLFCATLTDRRGGHTPFCTSRSGNVRHRCRFTFFLLLQQGFSTISLREPNPDSQFY